jgi:hypothetical protein
MEEEREERWEEVPTSLSDILGCDDLRRELEAYRKPVEEIIWGAKS